MAEDLDGVEVEAPTLPVPVLDAGVVADELGAGLVEEGAEGVEDDSAGVLAAGVEAEAASEADEMVTPTAAHSARAAASALVRSEPVH